jgi:peroxiredoxin Q/BCP
MAKPKVGDQAPDFELPGTGGKIYRLADYRGRKLVLAFYPGDFTAVCTKQFCSYRNDQDRIDGLGVPLLGISPQSVGSHERFVAKHQLSTPLLADPDKRVAHAYGIVGPGGFIRRSVFLIDDEGVVRYRHVAKLGLGYHDAGDLERAVAELG